MDRLPLLLLEESLITEAKPLPKEAKAALDRVVVNKIKRRLGLTLTFTASTSSPLSYNASFLKSDGRGVEHRLEIMMLMGVWSAKLYAYPYGYIGSRSRTVLVGSGEGPSVNDALNNMKKPVSESDYRGGASREAFLRGDNPIAQRRAQSMALRTMDYSNIDNLIRKTLNSVVKQTGWTWKDHNGTYEVYRYHTGTTYLLVAFDEGGQVVDVKVEKAGKFTDKVIAALKKAMPVEVR